VATKSFPPGGTIILRSNISLRDIVRYKLCPNNPFWKDVLLIWAKLNVREPVTRPEMPSQFIWYNSHVKVQNKVIYYPIWVKAGIMCIKD
jgi:hypothetical protein